MVTSRIWFVGKELKKRPPGKPGNTKNAEAVRNLKAAGLSQAEAEEKLGSARSTVHLLAGLTASRRQNREGAGFNAASNIPRQLPFWLPALPLSLLMLLAISLQCGEPADVTLKCISSMLNVLKREGVIKLITSGSETRTLGRTAAPGTLNGL